MWVGSHGLPNDGMDGEVGQDAGQLDEHIIGLVPWTQHLGKLLALVAVPDRMQVWPRESTEQ